VLNINTTAGRKYKVTLYMLSGVRPNASSTAVTTTNNTNNKNDPCPSTGMVASPCTATKQAIRVMDLETLNPIAPEPLLKPVRQHIIRIIIMMIISQSRLSSTAQD
jgi:hypothetical protein